jgi:hypothetical protein
MVVPCHKLFLDGIAYVFKPPIIVEMIVPSVFLKGSFVRISGEDMPLNCGKLRTSGLKELNELLAELYSDEREWGFGIIIAILNAQKYTGLYYITLSQAYKYKVVL